MIKGLVGGLLIAVLSVSFAWAQGEPPIDEMFKGETVSRDELLSAMPDDVVVGKATAPVTIIEYASMSCSHCADFYNDTFKELKTKYIDTGKAKYILRDFPLDEPALRGAMLARCSAKKGGAERFEKFVNVMFSTQDNWVTKKNFLEVLSNIAKLGGMKGDEFDACMADSALEKSVLKSKFFGLTQLSVRSTPTFFINGEEHKGAKPLEYFVGVIDGLLSGNAPKAAAPAEGAAAPVAGEAKVPEAPKKDTAEAADKAKTPKAPAKEEKKQ